MLSLLEDTTPGSRRGTRREALRVGGLALGGLSLADLLAALDLYVAPGPIETFGLSAVEAMACGTPLLSVNRGGVADHVHASGAGRVYDIGQPASLTEQAVALLQEDLPALGRTASAHAAREHAWPAVFARLFAVYREVGACA